MTTSADGHIAVSKQINETVTFSFVPTFLPITGIVLIKGLGLETQMVSPSTNPFIHEDHTTIFGIPILNAIPSRFRIKSRYSGTEYSAGTC